MNADFKTICDNVLALHGKSLTHAAQLSVIEDLRLRFFYPDEHVAFIDRWDERGTVRRLIRKVLAHSKSPDEVEKELKNLGTEKVRTVKVRYIEPLEADVELPQDVGQR